MIEQFYLTDVSIQTGTTTTGKSGPESYDK